MARRRRAWLTPDTFEGAVDICRPLVVPLPLLTYVGGALAALTEPHNWEQSGTMTPEEAAEHMTAVFASWLGDCIGEPCVFPADPRFGLTINVRLIRRGATGHTEELIDGVWTTPTGDYEVPPIPARAEPTADERKCLAAANAANVMAITYEEATDAWTAEHTELALWGAILDSLIALVGAFAGPTAVAYATYAKSVTDIFVEGFDAIAADVWTPAFTDELACIFYQSADDTASVVTFDFNAINEELFRRQGEAIVSFDENKALLMSQVGYLLSVMAASGLDTAGATTAIVAHDCSNCDDDWCYTFDFTASNGGFAPYASRAVWNAGTGWGRGATVQQVCQITKAFGLTAHVTRIDMAFNMPPGGQNVRQMRANDVNGAVFNLDVTNVPTPLTYTWAVNHDITGIWVSGAAGTATTPILPADFRITRLTLFGTQAGGNPFGADNC